MTKQKVMQEIVELAARQRDEGDSGQEFVATSMFAIASVCAASDFPQEEVQSLAAEAIEQGFKKMDEVAQREDK
jgi:hypothetical protein